SSSSAHSCMSAHASQSEWAVVPAAALMPLPLHAPPAPAAIADADAPCSHAPPAIVDFAALPCMEQLPPALAVVASAPCIAQAFSVPAVVAAAPLPIAQQSAAPFADFAAVVLALIAVAHAAFSSAVHAFALAAVADTLPCIEQPPSLLAVTAVVFMCAE